MVKVFHPKNEVARKKIESVKIDNVTFKQVYQCEYPTIFDGKLVLSWYEKDKLRDSIIKKIVDETFSPNGFVSSYKKDYDVVFNDKFKGRLHGCFLTEIERPDLDISEEKEQIVKATFHFDYLEVSKVKAKPLTKYVIQTRSVDGSSGSMLFVDGKRNLKLICDEINEDKYNNIIRVFKIKEVKVKIVKSKTWYEED